MPGSTNLYQGWVVGNTNINQGWMAGSTNISGVDGWQY